MTEVRVRIAPSPTGIPHIGNTRTGLYNYLFARHHGGKFFIRIEDTDQERLVPESLPKILEIFSWLGINFDNEPYVQSEHLSNYQQAAKKLVDENLAYYCFCTKERLENLRQEQSVAGKPPRYDRHCLTLSQEEIQRKLANKTPYVVRLKVPQNRLLSWVDLIRGKITVSSNEVDDQVLLKSDGFPTYHLAVVFDDNLMKITHVLRGAEWISSTPKHILLYEAFGYKKPQWGHLPLILGSDRSKLSKRHGAQSALDYRDQGYLPEALLNTMLFWGWSPKNNQQFFTLQEMIEAFDVTGINKNDPIVDLAKFDFFNAHYIRQTPDKKLFDLLEKNFLDETQKQTPEKILKILPLIKDRMKKLADWPVLSKCFFVPPEKTATQKLLKSLQIADWKAILLEIQSFITKSQNWQNNDIWQRGLRTIADTHRIKHGDLFMILRIAICGEKITPPLYETMVTLGYDESLKRIKSAVE